jgi:hypothetical protein
VKTAALLALGFSGLLFLRPAAGLQTATLGPDSGTLAIYFMDEQVGYEDYSWTAVPEGYRLEVSGRMTKPLRLEVESMTLLLSPAFIPLRYSFRGSLNGMAQEVTSVFQEGRVRNTVRVAGQENVTEVPVRRDALILPNPLFSPYLVLAKKYDCRLEGKTEVTVYIIPQVEIGGTLEGSAEAPCALTLTLAGVQVMLEMDPDHHLAGLSIPAQRLRVTVETRGSA